MKKYLAIIAIVAVCVAGYFYFAKDTVQAPVVIDVDEDVMSGIDLQHVTLPEGITRVERVTYHPDLDAVLLTTQDANNTYGLWSYDGKDFTELKNIDKPYFNGHVFVMDDETIYFNINNPARLYRSTDNGTTWDTVMEDIGMFWAMTEDDNGFVYGSLWSYNEPYIYRSIDHGDTWELWQDFSEVFPDERVPYEGNTTPPYRLRHMHDIVFAGGCLYAGMGDVFRTAVRSCDDGHTWTHIWDEGFTAHIVTSDRLIMGADVSSEKGIATYDLREGLTQDVWVPEGGWQGYTYSMTRIGDMYYSAMHIENNRNGGTMTYGMLQSLDGISWEPMTTWQTTRELTELFITQGPHNTIYIVQNGNLFAYTP